MVHVPSLFFLIFLFWNVRCLNPDILVALSLLKPCPPCIALAETWAPSPDLTPCIFGYRCYAATRSGPCGHGGIAIYVSTDYAASVPVWRLCPFGNYLWLNMHLSSSSCRVMYLAVCYFPPSGSHAYPFPSLASPYNAFLTDCLAA